MNEYVIIHWKEYGITQWLYYVMETTRGNLENVVREIKRSDGVVLGIETR